MRIAIFTETYLPQINGVVTHIKILKEGLEALGHTVLIVTADSKAHTHYLKDNVLHCPAHNLKPRLSGQPHTLKISAGISSRHHPCPQRV